jgi:pyruvate,water dikinase
VGQLGLAVEQHLGAPQDIEWTIADQHLWLLQSRPITTLPADVRRATHFPIEWTNEEERRRLWWLVQQNHRPSATLLPAEIEFMKVNTLGGQAAVIMGGGAKTRWRKYVNGRVYMAVADSPVSPAERRIRRAALQDLLARLQQQGQTLWDYAGPEVIRATERLDAFDGNQTDGPALADHLEDTLAAAHRHLLIHTLQPRHGPFEALLATYAQITGKSPEAAEEDLFFWLQGAETVQTRLIERLYDLAVLAVANPALAEWLQDPAPDRYARRSTLVGAENFWQQFAQLLTLYGGRIGLFSAGVDGQSDVEIPLPWREAPEALLDMIARYLPAARGNGAAAPRAAREQAARDLQARVDALCAVAPDPALAAEFRQRIAYARRAAAFLDDHNHYIDQLSEGQYAQALVYAGRWLAGRGDLPYPYAIFWLHPPEILAALRLSTRQEFGPMLRERQQRFTAWCKLQAPAYIGLPDPRLPPRPPLTASTEVEARASSLIAPNLLIGQPASMGQGVGRARIVPAATTLPVIAPGEVLVAANADPLWMPIFPTLAGIVLDGGGPGDHAAITAREFGIPAVFGTGNATQRISPSAWVTVDGATGRVTWE